jgi:hypothetical protein
MESDLTPAGMKSSLFAWHDCVIAAVPIGIGASIYLLFRGRGIWVFKFVEAVGGGSVIEAARQITRPLNPYVSGFTLYSLPTGLWAFSFIFCVVTIWRVQLKSFGAIFIIMLTVIVVLGAELAQAFGIFSGRFDAADLFGNVVGLIFGGIVAYAKGFCKREQIRR